MNKIHIISFMFSSQLLYAAQSNSTDLTDRKNTKEMIGVIAITKRAYPTLLGYKKDTSIKAYRFKEPSVGLRVLVKENKNFCFNLIFFEKMSNNHADAKQKIVDAAQQAMKEYNDLGLSTKIKSYRPVFWKYYADESIELEKKSTNLKNISKL